MKEMPNSVKVYQYTLEGKFVAEFESINYAAKKTGNNFSGIRGCIEGKYSHSGGYVWRKFYSPKIYPEFKSGICEDIQVPVRIKKEGYDYLEFPSISDAARFIGCSRSSLSQVVNKLTNAIKIKGWSIERINK